MGWSVHDYAAEKQRLVQAGNLKPRAARLANAHNTFLEVWLHNGLVTLVPLLALLGYAAIQFGRRIRDPDCIVQLAATAGLTLVVCYIIFSQTQVMLGRNNTLTFFLITLMIFWAIMRAREAQLRDGTQSSFICN
jgi:O-antigen ligase